MLFNSIDFAIFLPIVFILYWFVTNHSIKLQNSLLLISSYIFYGWWDWRFLTLIILSSGVDYCVGVGFSNIDDPRRRKLLLTLSIFVNLGLLGFFKYYNFLLENFVDAFSIMGHSINPRALSLILPVGISFYTFQTLSYSIDTYKRKIEPTKDILAFFAFVSFFPQLVAGPIERAANLLPQFQTKKYFHYGQAVDGLRQILWGLFKKIVIADNCARYANDIFGDYSSFSGSTLLLGAIFFSFQIYGDFSGYSDIAIGTARLFGFNLKRNFAFPYFSRDIAEFWRRWHISLSSWFRDYVYIPLGGSRGGVGTKLKNTFAVFIVSGFWHGANWTFIAWGALNAIYFLPLMLLNKHRDSLDSVAAGKIFPSLSETIRIIITYLMTLAGWILFRSETIYDAIQYFKGIMSWSLREATAFSPTWLFVLIVLFLIAEWVQREKQHALHFDGVHIPRPIRWVIYYGIIAALIHYGGTQQEFIYFQF